MTTFQEHARELIIYQERCELQQKNLESQDQELADKVSLIPQLEKQLAIVSDQVNRLEKNRAQAEDKIETLPELQGCLKLLETIK